MYLLRAINTNLHKFMAVPAILLFALFFIYPLTQGIGISLTNWNGVSQAKFVGMQNFVDFFHDDRAKHDLYNTLFFALGSAPLLNIFGLAYALILDRNFKGKGVVRAIVYLPAVISPLIMGYVWYFILQPGRGFLYHILDNMNLGFMNTNWLGDSSSAMKVLVMVNVWQFVGMTMIIYLAGLQSIPAELYESSKIDGAGYFATLHSITIPLLYPAIQINVVTNIIGSLSVFEIIVALTDGGPGYSTESLSIYILRMLYGSFTGYSTAVALLLFVIIVIPVIIFMRLTKSREIEM
ncbi:Melibiose/raffinose/stachyose import permease protein MelD [Paenibacillus allorhizoplanae]|uniref:Melibiose/raffinose/stachyose import permease protein MelD n=1 Tax=Paenibacillus allorhizoplanae TaxID=2905648 RepID=A0ABM9CM24_9BACL|nr:sugar ABC transporter permease [Paenibacillus allorhizoplanae]CAH1216783.1 Melibiose/raffinose/stachyose import permease protein MelD [Paenibacillus allorhizoplanae]